MVVCSQWSNDHDSDGDLCDLYRVVSEETQEAAGRCTKGLGHG